MTDFNHQTTICSVLITVILFGGKVFEYKDLISTRDFLFYIISPIPRMLDGKYYDGYIGVRGDLQMDRCASSNNESATKIKCPSCGKEGKNMNLITLKSLLKASALETLEPDNSYLFCSTSVCTTVYFSVSHSQTFAQSDLKLSVYQKDPGMDVPVCYCFDWTRERLIQAVRTVQQPANQIKAHVRAGRCGCEVNNPQGACCLGNVSTFVQELKR